MASNPFHDLYIGEATPEDELVQLVSLGSMSVSGLIDKLAMATAAALYIPAATVTVVGDVKSAPVAVLATNTAAPIVTLCPA